MDNKYLSKQAKSVGLGIFAVVSTYLLQYFGDLNFGVYTPIATAILAVVGNLVKEFNLEEEDK